MAITNSSDPPGLFMDPGLSATDVASLRQMHGHNKLVAEEKVCIVRLTG